MIEKQSPIQHLKGIKNSVEIEGIRNAHIRDAAAKVMFFEISIFQILIRQKFQIQFLHWLEDNIPQDEQKNSGKVYTEFDIAEVLESFRK